MNVNLVLVVAAVALAGWIALTLVIQHRRFSKSRVTVRAGRSVEVRNLVAGSDDDPSSSL